MISITYAGTNTQVFCTIVQILRVSYVTIHVHCQDSVKWDSRKCLRKAGVQVTDRGVLLHTCWSKNIQHKERVLTVPIWLMPAHHLCPTSVLGAFFSKPGALPADLPFLVYRDSSMGLVALTLANLNFAQSYRALWSRQDSTIQFITHIVYTEEEQPGC